MCKEFQKSALSTFFHFVRIMAAYQPHVSSVPKMPFFPRLHVDCECPKNDRKLMSLGVTCRFVVLSNYSLYILDSMRWAARNAQFPKGNLANVLKPLEQRVRWTIKESTLFNDFNLHIVIGVIQKLRWLKFTLLWLFTLDYLIQVGDGITVLGGKFLKY